jgi:hypothetical protein
MPFLILVLFSLQSYAVTISRIMSRPEGTSVQTYQIENGKAQLERKTNAFGPSNDLRLGSFHTNKNFASVEKKLMKLTPPASSEAPQGHEIFFKVGDRVIKPALTNHQ